MKEKDKVKLFDIVATIWFLPWTASNYFIGREVKDEDFSWALPLGFITIPFIIIFVILFGLSFAVRKIIGTK